MVGMQTPELVKNMGENRLMYGIMGFFVFAQVSQALRSTGAFEITINEKLVFSKLETGDHIKAH